jgi:hypothetical protein
MTSPRPVLVEFHGVCVAHDPEKACPGLDPGLADFSDKIMRKQEDRKQDRFNLKQPIYSRG